MSKSLYSPSWYRVSAMKPRLRAHAEIHRQRFRGALLLGAALVGVTGFLGSALIYGLDHYAWN